MTSESASGTGSFLLFLSLFSGMAARRKATTQDTKSTREGKSAAAGNELQMNVGERNYVPDVGPIGVNLVWSYRFHMFVLRTVLRGASNRLECYLFFKFAVTTRNRSMEKLPVLSRAAVRDVDRLAVNEFGLSGLILMENAGRGCADVLCRIDPHGPVVICCGRGNNAGDGLVMARHLDLRGIEVRLLFWSDPNKLTGEAQVNWDIARRAGLPIDWLNKPYDPNLLAKHLEHARWIVDALLGTGARGAPRPPLDEVIRQLNDHSASKLAIDIPSGLDADSGDVSEATFRADHTGTFVAAKPGMVVPQNAHLVGRIHVLDIGAPRKLVTQFI